MALAALVFGADGLLIEVHPQPAEALSDGPQSLALADFATLMKQIAQLLDAGLHEPYLSTLPHNPLAPDGSNGEMANEFSALVAPNGKF
jgi:hypothetical protein